MSNLNAMTCEACGGRLNEKANGVYECECCLNTYTFDKVKEYSQLLNEKFDSFKLEKLSNLKNLLWRALGEKYISNNQITNICEQIKVVDADDLYANFFSLACAESANNRAIVAFLNNINAKQKGAAVSRLIEFMLRSPELLEGCSTPVIKLIEGAFSRTSESYQKYYGEYQKQMQKIDQGIFDVTLPRDAFIAYSSKDETKVVELVDYLEGHEKMSCFVSLRNLQHGSGSVENYEKQLEMAIDNCKVFVFVSSQNSRSNACDALKREIPYVRAKDISLAGVYAQQGYDNIPLKYKKPRVEYVISDYIGEGIAERKTAEFFAGIERVYNKQAVAERIFEATNKKFDFTPDDTLQTQQPKVEQPKVEQPKVEQQKSTNTSNSNSVKKTDKKSSTNKNLITGGLPLEDFFSMLTLRQEYYGKGKKYYYGRGVTKDYVEAVKWYKKSAEQGHVEAQYSLGFCYEYGQGVTKDYAEAFKWYKKAAEQGYADAQYNLGYCYKHGQGVKQNKTEAKKWYQKAAEQGDEHAKKALKELNGFMGLFKRL